MNKTSIEWAKNPDGTPGYTWNPITGCLNNCEYCYAKKLADTRLRTRYLENKNVAPLQDGWLHKGEDWEVDSRYDAPFYPRFWPERLDQPIYQTKPSGIFTVDMGELFGDWIPLEWQANIFEVIERCPQHRFYLLTKQPQSLVKFDIPNNCWVGVTMTNGYDNQLVAFRQVKAKVKYISFEPLLKWSDWATSDMTKKSLKDAGINWVIIGSQTKPYKPPKIEWVQEIVEACDKAGIPVFLKDNLEPIMGGYPIPKANMWAYRFEKGAFNLRQEMP